MSNVIAAILGFFVSVIGWAVVAGALALLAVLVALHAYEAAQAAWRRVKRSCDATFEWWP